VFPLISLTGTEWIKEAAASAIAAGLSKVEVRLLGRWKSDTVDLYINELGQDEFKSKMLKLHSSLPATSLALSPPSDPTKYCDASAYSSLGLKRTKGCRCSHQGCGPPIPICLLDSVRCDIAWDSPIVGCTGFSVTTDEVQHM
jgi:hypothetical protein